MAKIFISTNGDKPKNLYTSDADKEKVEKFLTDNGFTTGASNVEKQVFKDVCLISDELETLTSLQVDNRDDYLLYHNVKKDTLLNLFDKKTEGNHMIGVQYKYKDVYDILLGSNIQDNDKAKAIIEFLFPTAEAILGKKLDLLHSLLVPPTDDLADAIKQWDEIQTLVTNAAGQTPPVIVPFPNKSVLTTTFKTAIDGKTDAFDKDYLKALTDLRDALLA